MLVTLAIDPAGLPAGTYRARIATGADDGAENPGGIITGGPPVPSGDDDDDEGDDGGDGHNQRVIGSFETRPTSTQGAVLTFGFRMS